MLLHANAVTQNRTAAVRTGGIHGDDSDLLAVFSIQLRELINQRTLASAGRACQSNGARAASMREEFFEELGPSRRVILNRRDGAGQRARIVRPNLFV